MHLIQQKLHRAACARPYLLASALLAAGALVATPARADLILDFNSGPYDPATTYITFTGGSFSATFAGTDTAVQEGVSYSVSQLTGGVDVTNYTKGRVFVSLGSQLTGLSASNGYEPNFLNPNLPNFYTRMDKYEITYNGTSGGADLSSTDFFGIPMMLTSTGGHLPTTLTWNYSSTVNSATVFQSLGKLANYTTDTPANALGALVPNGNNGVTINTPNGQLKGVVRIIAPSTTNGGTTPYPDLTPYLNYIQSNQIVTDIEGQNGQYPQSGPFQNYKLNVYIANTAQTIDGLSISRGDLVFTGTVTLGGTTENLTFKVAQADLTNFSVYGADFAYDSPNPNVILCPGCTDDHNVVEKAAADYFAGLNFGFIGSPEANPNDPGQTIGASPSWTWYGNQPNGGGPDPLPLSDAYAVAQPDNADCFVSDADCFFNSYAAYLNNSSDPVTDSYGFPYTDRLTSPLAALDPNTTLTLTILPDTVNGLGASPVPEPPTWPLLAVGFAGLATYAGLRRRGAVVEA